MTGPSLDHPRTGKHLGATSLKAGDKVVVLEEWPLRPGSNVKLSPGDEAVVVRTTGNYCAIEIFGTVVVVPSEKLQFVEDPTVPDPPLDEDWWKF